MMDMCSSLLLAAAATAIVVIVMDRVREEELGQKTIIPADCIKGNSVN